MKRLLLAALLLIPTLASAHHVIPPSVIPPPAKPVVAVVDVASTGGTSWVPLIGVAFAIGAAVVQHERWLDAQQRKPVAASACKVGTKKKYHRTVKRKKRVHRVVARACR